MVGKKILKKFKKKESKVQPVYFVSFWWEWVLAWWPLSGKKSCHCINVCIRKEEEKDN